MAKPNRLLEIENEHGDLHKIIPDLVNVGGQKHAAEVLGTTQATISKWLKDNHYKQNIIYSQEEAATPNQMM